MRIDNGKTKTKARASLAGMCIALALASCSNLQDSLSSEMEAKLLEETGTPTLAGNTWYYNGTAGEDVSADSGFLKIDFGQQVAEGTNGISGSFLISYTDSESRECSIKKELAGGFPGTETYNLDMSPVIEMLDGNTFYDGTATVTVNLSGLVCDAGKQKGRSVSSLSQKIKIKPLYSSENLSGGFINTTSAPAGTKFSLEIDGAVALTEASSISVSSSDSTLSGAERTLDSVSSDGHTIYFYCDTDIANATSSADITVTGLRPLTEVLSYDLTFAVNFAPGTLCTDVNSSSSFNFKNVLVRNDSENLYVTVNLSSETSLWNNNGFAVLVDNPNDETGGVSASESWDGSLIRGIAKTVSFASGTSVEAIVEVTNTVTDSVGSITVSGNGSATSAFTDGDWGAKKTTSVTFAVPLSEIGNPSSGESVYVFACGRGYESATTYDSGITDWASSEAVTESADCSSWAGLKSAVTIDMTKSISHTITE